MKKAIQIAYDENFEMKCEFAHEAGFPYIAVNYTQINGKTEEEWKQITENIGRILDNNHLSCIQTHPHYYDLLLSSEIRDDAMEFNIKQSIISSGKLGAKYCVIHPRSSVSSGYRTSKSYEDNKKWFSELLDVAVKNGTAIAAENLPIFPSSKKIMPFYSSNYDELATLVDSFNDENMVICWDTGHANLLCWDQAQAIKYLNNRIKCTHIHNNFGNADRHLPPDCGGIDWDSVMQAFSEIGYDGPFTLETHCLYPSPELLRAFAKYNYACLEYMESCIK